MTTTQTISDTGKIEKRKWDIFTENEIRDLLDAVDTGTALGLRDRAILELAYGMGIRPGELLSLRLRDVNESEETLTVAWEADTRCRIIPVGERAMRFLRRYLEEGRKNFRNAETLPWLFLSAKGTQMKSSGISAIVQKYASRIGVTRRVSAGMIRNTAMAHLYYHGAPISMIRELLGLKSVGMVTAHARMELQDLKKVYRVRDPGNGGLAA